MKTFKITFKDNKASLVTASDFSVNTLLDTVTLFTLTKGNYKVALYRFSEIKSIECVEDESEGV